MGDPAGADDRDPLAHALGGVAYGLPQGVNAVQRRQRRVLAIDVHGNDRQIVVGRQMMQRHHDAVVEFPFLAIAEIHALHHALDQAQGNIPAAWNPGTGNAQPLGVFDGAVVVIRHAHRERRHIVHKKIGEMLGRDHYQRIRTRIAQRLAHAPITLHEVFPRRGLAAPGARRNTRAMAAHAAKYNTHGFSFFIA